MKSPSSQRRWRWPNLLLWTVFFAVGLMPDAVFSGLRRAGGVVTQHAWVNSVNLLVYALAAYFAWFVYSRCLEAGLGNREARAKALQSAVLALAAFLPMGLEQFLWYQANLTADALRVLYAFAVGKLLLWMYLASIVARYYFGGYEVFRRMPTLFPSARAGAAEEKTAEPGNDTETRT